jgi:formylmethanofuran--tetrahydromethanopterin N-formyltransferase
VRISQNVLTCPTTACFNLLDTVPYYKLGRKVACFGDGFQFRDIRHGRPVWVVPILSGEFVIDRRFGYQNGVMGGNLWFLGRDLDSALAAAERGEAAIAAMPGVITPFPGGIVGSGSKTGSRYAFAIASTYERFCPTLRGVPGVDTALPDDVNAVIEIIIDGRDLQSVGDAMQAAIAASAATPGLVRISAGNYGGRLGKSLIYLHPHRQPRD